MKQSEYLKSPIYYQGNKFRLMDELKEKLPKNINNFYDVFGGSGTVSINFLKRAKQIHYNEFNKWVFKLFKFFNENEPEKINQEILKIIDEFNLPKNTDFKKQGNSSYKENFKKMEETLILRDKTNPIHMATIINYSFCKTLKTNENGLICSGCGNESYNENGYKTKMKNIYNKKINLTNESFEYFVDKEFEKDDFIYLDPPYWNTNADYNKIWNFELEQKLLNWLEVLTSKGIKWALSNVENHRGKFNIHLIEWIKKNNYWKFNPKIVYTLGEKDATIADTKEVLVLNYDPLKESNYSEQLKLF